MVNIIPGKIIQTGVNVAVASVFAGYALGIYYGCRSSQVAVEMARSNPGKEIHELAETPSHAVYQRLKERAIDAATVGNVAGIVILTGSYIWSDALVRRRKKLEVVVEEESTPRSAP